MRKSPTSAELKFPAESELRGSAGHTSLLTLVLLIISELPYAWHKILFVKLLSQLLPLSLVAANCGILAAWQADMHKQSSS